MNEQTQKELGKMLFVVCTGSKIQVFALANHLGWDGDTVDNVIYYDGTLGHMNEAKDYIVQYVSQQLLSE